MQTEPVRPPSLSFDADGVPSAPDFGDVYHARAGAWGQARHVFLGGNGLPERWGGREDFCILETGFGLGRNFLSTWQAWREDPRRPRRLHYLGIEKHPPTRAQLEAVRRQRLQHPADSPPGIDALEAALHEAWPSLTANVHALDFEGGRVRLLLAFFDVRAVLSELVAEVDAFYLDGFAPDRNPAMWDTHVIKAIGRLAAPGATAATWSVARGLRDALTTAGFQTEKAPGYGSKREMTVARHAPPPGWRGAPSRRSASAGRPACVAIVGAGLAGCTLAAALADLGIASTLFDRHSRPAQEASGQAAGLYHGVVTPQDGTHARFNRAAALQAARDYARWRTAGLFEAAGPEAASLIGSGLLRLEDEGALSSMQARLARLGLPDDHVRAVSADEAFDLTGLRPDGPGWWFAQGGAVRAGDVAEACRHLAGEALRWQGGVEVASLHRIAGDGAAGPAWALMDRHGKLLDQVDTVVLANAVDARRLLDAERTRSGMATGDGYGWPLQRLRGQTSAVTLAAWQHAGLPVPRAPVTGHGYLLPPRDGQLLFGATADLVGDDDLDIQPREADHARNLERLQGLLGAVHGRLPALRQAFVDTPLHGRVGWRLSTDDRLPMVGALPDLAALAEPGRRLDQPRLLPRRDGLYLFSALASRGLTWAPLAARTLAAWIAGVPLPIESSLVDAIDPGRHRSRAARRETSPR